MSIIQQEYNQVNEGDPMEKERQEEEKKRQESEKRRREAEEKYLNDRINRARRLEEEEDQRLEEEEKQRREAEENLRRLKEEYKRQEEEDRRREEVLRQQWEEYWPEYEQSIVDAFNEQLERITGGRPMLKEESVLSMRDDFYNTLRNIYNITTDTEAGEIKRILNEMTNKNREELIEFLETKEDVFF